MLRVSYARTLETPFNENLVLSSQGCANAVLSPLLAARRASRTPQPGFRNEFHAGFQQALGKHFVVSGEYIWKYTHNAFDFSVLGNTPITFPIDWHNSKIPGFALHVDVPDFHNFTAYVGHVFGGGALLPAAGRGRRRDRGADGSALPHRSRRELQPDHALAIHRSRAANPERPVGRIQLALRLGPGCRLGALLQPALDDPNSACDAIPRTTLNGQPASI